MMNKIHKKAIPVFLALMMIVSLMPAATRPASALSATTNALDVSVEGITQEEEALTGSYTYSDAGNDEESGSNYQWYRATDSLGTDAMVISESNHQTYMLTSDDVGSYICFEVTPSNGTDSGEAVKSSYTGQVTEDEAALLELGADETPAVLNADTTDYSIATVSQSILPGVAASMAVTQNICAPASNGGKFAQQPVIKLKDRYENICTNDSYTQVTADNDTAVRLNCERCRNSNMV